MSGELDFLVQHFAGRRGRFLDVGAFDGKTNSLTRELWAQGWRGVLVEPNPVNFLALLDLYGADSTVELVHAAMAATTGLAEFWGERQGGELSSLSRAHVKTFTAKHGKTFQRYHIATVSPKKLMAGFGGPRGWRFLNIDAEGISPEILAAFPLAEMVDLEVICVEHDGRLGNILPAVTPLGFVEKLHNDVNSMLAREVRP